MVRRYKMLSGQKRKRNKSDTHHKHVKEFPAEIMEEEEKEEVGEGINEPEIASKKNAEEVEKANAMKTGIDFPSFPNFAQGNNSDNRPGVIFILEKASLEVAKVGKNYQLLHSIKHRNFLKRNRRNPADYRPDIAHQALLAILDTPLNKSGQLKAVYVKTEKGVLFEIKPHVRIPRTYEGFAGLMLQLLQKLSITAVGKREKLLRTIQNPVTRYLPVESLKIGFSFSSEKCVDNLQDYFSGISKEKTLVFVVGAMAHGRIDVDYVDDFISIEEYPLSAACCINMICLDVYRKWKRRRYL